MGDVGNRRGCACVGTGGKWQVSTSPKFCSKPKTALLKRSLLKKMERVEDRGAAVLQSMGLKELTQLGDGTTTEK